MRERLGLELVPEAADGEHVTRFGGIGLDLGAQRADVDVDKTAVAEVAVAPHPLEQDLAGEDPAGLLASSTRSRNSVLVRWTSSSPSMTMPWSGRICEVAELELARAG